MRLLARMLRFVLALGALLAYGVLPVLGFAEQGTPLYLASGLTAALFFSWWYALPLAGLLLQCIGCFAGRFYQKFSWLLSVLGLALVIALPWNLLTDGANAAWLMSNATTMRALLAEGLGEQGDAMLLQHAVKAGMAQRAWGQFVALGLCVLAYPFYRPRNRRRELADWDA